MPHRRVLNVANRMRIQVPLRPAGRELHRFTVGGRALVYDANAMTLAAEGDAPADDAASHFRPDFPPPEARRDASHLVLTLTHCCSLRCRYCFVPHEEGPRWSMTLDAARRAMELLLPAHRPATVAFFGGEPLLEWDLLTQIVEAGKRLRRGAGRLQFHLTTNGTLLDPKKADVLDREGFSLIVSLDGPREVHDRWRTAADGAGSYEATVRGLRNLRGRRLAARTTLRATVPACDLQLRERLEHLHRLLDEGLARHVALEPASSLPGTGDGASYDAPSVDWDAVDSACGEAARFLRDRVRARRPASFEPLVAWLRRLAYREPAASVCNAGNGYVAAAPDGTLYACHREGASRIGHLAAGGLDESLRAPWLDNRFYLSARCLECPIRLVCGGPCRQDALERGGLHAPPDSCCRMRDAWFRWAAWLLAELSPQETARLTGRRATPCCGQKH